MEVNRQLQPSAFNWQHQRVCAFLSSEVAPNYVYDHQIEAVQCASEQLNNQDKPNIALVVLPTGCGKTGVAVLAAYALDASRVLVITPSLTISKQIHEAFCGGESRDCFLLERGIIPSDDVDQVCPQGTYIKATSEIRMHRNDPLMVVNAHKIGGLSSVKIEDIPNDRYDLVIVDEAHHYPAPTWRLLVDHFHNSRRLFITATPEYKGNPILEYPACFTLSRRDAVQRGIIRDIDFHEVPWQNGGNDVQLQRVAVEVREFLNRHDQQDPRFRHQAMVLAQTVVDLNSAQIFKEAYDVPDDICEIYAGSAPKEVLNRFNRGEFRTLVVVGKLREGYDNKRVSVGAIVRNVAPQSKVLFAQFVGRAVRKFDHTDPVTTMIVSHEMFRQRGNFEQFDQVAEEENIDEQ